MSSQIAQKLLEVHPTFFTPEAVRPTLEHVTSVTAALGAGDGGYALEDPAGDDIDEIKDTDGD
jgi:hypothetical protein